jgi:hypothetical protein
MFKKLAFPAIALMAALALVPSQASARVRFGIAVGAAPVYPAPAYSYPAYPDYYAYPAPSYPAYQYAAPYPYAPAYVAPYSGFGFSWGGHRDRDWGHERHEFREHHEGGRRR